MRLANDSPSFTPVHPQIRAIGPRDLHHAKGRGPGDLEEVTATELKQQRKREQLRATSLTELIAVGQRRGMKNPRGWARHVLAARQTKGNWCRVA
jgi:hypothetical protein